MLKMTGVMLAFVLVTMVGTTVHVLQVVGWAPITPIAELRLPYWTGVWLGTYATWEGVIAQALAVVLVVGSYFLAEYLHDRSLDQRSAMAASSTSSSLASS